MSNNERATENGTSSTVAVLLPHGVEARICAEIAARAVMGRQKYGVSVADNPLSLREWLEHAKQEAMDAAIYLQRAIDELDKGVGRG